jgi:hypothetical protein
MAEEFPTFSAPEADAADYSELFDSGQLDNLWVGINKGTDGFKQALTEVKEALGLVPRGATSFKTQELKKRQKVLEDATYDDQELTGASAVEFAGEVLPLFAVPLGGTIPRAVALGAGASSGFFHEDPQNTSRLADIALGGASGGLFRALLRGGGAAAEQVKNSVKKLQLTGPGGRGGQRALPNQQPRLPAPQPREDLGRATIVPEELGGPAARAQLQGPQVAGLLPAPKPSPTRGLGADDFQLAGQEAAARTRGVAGPSAVARAETAAQKALRARANMNGKAAAAAQKKAERFARAAARKLKALEKAAKFSKSNKALTRTMQLMSKTRSDKVAANVMAKYLAALRGAQKASAPIPVKPKTPAAPAAQAAPEAVRKGNRAYIDGKATTKWDMVQEIKKTMPANQTGHLHDPNNFSLDDVINMYNRATKKAGGPGGKQAGFTESNTLNTLGGAAAGATLGAAATDGDPVGILAGALGGGLAGRHLSKRLGRSDVQTNKMREGMRKASEQGGNYNEKITRAAKARDFTKETLSEVFTGVRNVLDQFFGATSTRLEALSPRLAVALKNAEYQQHVRANEWLEKGDQIFARIDGANLTDAQQRALKITLLNSTAGAKRYLNALGKTDAANAVDEFDALLAEVGDYLQGVDLGQNLRKNYFPRMVTDIGYFEKIEEVDSYLKHLAKKKGVSLTDFEKEVAISEVINGALTRGPEQTHFARAAAQLQKRTVKVTSKNVDAYADAKQGFADYVEGITTQVERRRFFKGQNVKVDDIGPNAENIDSVASRLAKELAKGDMSVEEVEEAANLIRLRFGLGEQAPHKAVQNFKNLTYTGLLGNPLAAMTQFGDVALAAHRNGIGNTARAVVQQLARKNNPLAGLDKQGLLGIRNAASDFASRTSTRDLLNWSLRYSGFQKADHFGKNTFIQSAMMKNQQMGKDEFFQKWSKVFDPEGQGTPRTEKLWNDVQNYKGLTPENREDLGFMLWNELEGVQPIALSALPQRYLQHPNGRMAYMLQSFTLKLFDVMRKDIYQQAAQGNYRAATKNAVRLSSLFVSMNGGVDAAKNFILNKDMDVPEVVLNNYMKMAGFNKYMFDNIGREGLGSSVLKTLAPPTSLLDAVTDPRKALQQLPPLGRIIEGRIPE